MMLSIIALLSGALGALVSFSSCSSRAVNLDSATNSGLAIASTTPAGDIRKWIAPTFLGIKVGESTEKDVRGLFGKPDDEYPNSYDDKVFEKDAEDEVVQGYRTLKEANGQVVVILGKKSRLVKAMSLYPGEQISLDQATSKYGKAFFQIESWESYCVKDGCEPGTVNKGMTYPFVLVYPSSGIAVDIRNYDAGIYVGRIDYMMKCN